ncbi:Gfo/Idh/MocA family oxidoreductase [Paenibacillus hemerocallicola]|uniref:Gfo/Idh/MocA family oxidoreductase n=1 Tax=Paenibacillus hemerocallicola TaxID=1172614 RepID=A0A5C4TAF9_9BACL|nr:Gfo/Idh/MocA family oxidoreductase [Paenibacillus hemerocallicola]TNJ65971.1 Gfo/Idh/MocA family oxidoreductase [Paenibacillus hemerocallicola]
MREVSKGKIKIGQIGVGHVHAAGKMEALRRLSDIFEVVGVAEPDPVWREKNGGKAVYNDLPWMTEEQLLNTPGLQAVAVENDEFDLVPTASRCIAAGMHIHLDKPGGETLPPFREMLAEAGRKKLTVQLGYMYRTNPAIRFCLQAVREGWLGQIFEVHAVMSITQDKNAREWLARYKGGNMYIFGGHLIDLALSMLGKPDNITPYQRRTQPEKDDLYDNGFAVLEYPKTVVSIRSSAIEVEGFSRRQLVVCGDQGTIDIRPIEPPHHRLTESPKLRMALAQPRGGFQAGYQEVPLPPLGKRYDAQLIEFARIVRGEIENPYTLEHELLVQESLLKACGYPIQ